MSGDVVARAKAALEGVTDGPWVASKQRDSRPGPRMPQPYIYPGNIVSEATKQIVFTQTGNTVNSQFIAAARSLVPELVAEVEKLRGALETIRDTLNDDELGFPAQMADIRGKVHDTIGFERAGIEP